MRTQRISRGKGWVIEIILRVSHHSLVNRSVHPILPGAVPDDPPESIDPENSGAAQ
jgi:hypothetical protein